MDSRGNVYEIEDDKVISKASNPMPIHFRDRLVLAALDAGATPASLAPLRQEEREWVRKTLEERAGKGEG